MKLCQRCNNHFKDDLETCPNDDTRLWEAGNDPLIGSVIGERYKILNLVGRGSMGVVFRAIQISTGREMAIKFLLNFHEPDSDTVKRFQREAKTLSHLKHPNIITLFDFGFMSNGQPYIVTEFLRGVTLAHLLREKSYLPPRKAAVLLKQVCEAVSEAHKLKIVHRDIKPDNIILQGKDQGGRFVKVVDFGIAKLLGDAGGSESLTLDGKVCGSPAYMSPEQCKGLELNYRCDIYSLGVVIFETLTGKRPFEGDDAMAIMFQHVNDPPPTLKQAFPQGAFTPEMEAVMSKALVKEPSLRFKSVDELWHAFANACYEKNKPEKTEWIPFNAVSTRSVMEQVSGSQSDSWEFPDPISSRENVQYLHEFKRKRRKFWTQVSLVAILGAVALVYTLAGHDRVTVETADLLATHGRPEDAVWMLERVKGKSELSPENLEILNNAYLQTAIKLANKRRFGKAVDMLERVTAKSKYNTQANILLRRYRRKLPSGA
jgi:serine/threonine protein kinase